MRATLELPELHAQALEFLLHHIPPRTYPWVLIGSAGLRLQGVDVPVNDLDLQTDGESVYMLERLLEKFIKTPIHFWETEHTVSLHGQAEIKGVVVELIGDMKHRISDGAWDEPVNILNSRIWIEWRGRKVPVFPLELEAQAYSKMGRIKKAKLIREAIRS